MLLTHVEKVLLLREVALFEGLSGRDLGVVAEVAEQISLGPSVRVVGEHDDDDALYIVIRGSLGVFKGSRLMAMRRERECAGEMSLLTGDPHGVNVETLEESSLLSLRSSDFRRLLACHPEIALAIIKRLALRLEAASRIGV